MSTTAGEVMTREVVTVRGDASVQDLIRLAESRSFSGFPVVDEGGRALGLGELKFTGQVLPETKLVQYKIDIKRIINRKLVLGVADGQVVADGKVIYEATNLKVGLFDNPRSSL